MASVNIDLIALVISEDLNGFKYGIFNGRALMQLIRYANPIST